MIVVGVDGSEVSRDALERALELAATMDEPLSVVHVTHYPPLMLAALEQAPVQLDEIEAAERRLVWEHVDEVIAASDIDPMPAVSRVELSGYPPDAIVSFAHANAARMLVVGNRGRGALASLMLGSTSQRILHTAHCDVLVVKGEVE